MCSAILEPAWTLRVLRQVHFVSKQEHSKQFESRKETPQEGRDVALVAMILACVVSGHRRSGTRVFEHKAQAQTENGGERGLAGCFSPSHRNFQSQFGTAKVHRTNVNYWTSWNSGSH
eukprot:1691889-Rhodomonas_salina.2